MGVDILALVALMEANSIKLVPCATGGCAILIPLGAGCYERVVSARTKTTTARLQTQRVSSAQTNNLAEGFRPIKCEAQTSNLAEGRDNENIQQLLEKIKKQSADKLALQEQALALAAEIKRLKTSNEVGQQAVNFLSGLDEATKLEQKHRAVKCLRKC